MTTGMNWLFDSLTQQCIVCDDCPIVWHDSPANANEQQIDDALRLWLTSHFEHHCSQFTLSGTQLSTVTLLIQLATPCQVQAKSSLKSLGRYLFIDLEVSTQIKTQTCKVTHCECFFDAGLLRYCQLLRLRIKAQGRLMTIFSSFIFIFICLIIMELSLVYNGMAEAESDCNANSHDNWLFVVPKEVAQVDR